MSVFAWAASKPMTNPSVSMMPAVIPGIASLTFMMYDLLSAICSIMCH